MTRKERGFVLEGVAIIVAAFLLAIVAPGLVNQHDTMLTFAAFIMLGGAIGWCAYYVYRIFRENQK